MRNLAHMPVKGRMASALLRWEEQFGKTEEGCIDLPISRQDFAAYVGTSYETLFRLLNELVEEKQVRLIGKGIQLLNHSGLAVLAKI
jgi:CRP/FNR family transcriptional regulator